MSTTLIAGLIVAGLFLLLAIAYINHIVEGNKLKTARKRADLQDQARRCASLADALPGQLMSVELRLALAELELKWCQQLQAMDKRNSRLRERISGLAGLIAQAQTLKLDLPVRPITTQAQADETSLNLEDILQIFARGARDGLIPAAEAKRWQTEIRRLLVLMHLEHFSNLGQRSLQQNQPAQARLAYERAVQYLRKQPDVSAYAARLRQLEASLERANAMVLALQPGSRSDSELTAAVEEEVEAQDAWKKKNLYE
ncbi:hypothetical protein [Stutzerimonas tarimensis]|uniref:DNA repair protein n=1 Tax=Stutzerimonas tarimensis TaxID=1507735 RepID=A0ABV7T7L1_9GAMM